MALIHCKAFFRAVIFDIGWRVIKLSGFKNPGWDWSRYWHREILDRAESQLRLLNDEHAPASVKGWFGV